MHRLRWLARNTPAGRERYVDLLRAVAIVAVVSGHWLMTVIGHDASGQLAGHNALQELTNERVATWLFQVLPIFFLVGGYANAASLTSRTARGGGAGDWLVERSGRLLRPTSTFLAVLVVVAVVARWIGADPREIRTVIWFVTVPLWFLAPYLLVVVLTPVMFALHRRAGAAVPAVLVGLVALGDIGRLAGPAWLSFGNYLFGWLLPHQIGFAWRTGGLRIRPRAAAALAVGGLVALILLTEVGPYPTSMINLSGQRIQNMSPPSLALLSLAAAQLGVILLLRGPAERMLHRTRPWMLVVAINAVVLTIFLWHLTALLLLAGALEGLGLLPTPAAGSAGWWLLRPPWLVLGAIALAPLVAVFGPVEARAGRRRGARSSAGAGVPLPLPGPLNRTGPLRRTRPLNGIRPLNRIRPRAPAAARRLRAGLAAAGFLAVIVGLLANSRFPRAEPTPLGIPVWALAAYLGGAAALRLLRVTDPAGNATHSSAAHSSAADRPGAGSPATDNSGTDNSGTNRPAAGGS
ncbi:acyltransferase [Plantactinospora sp. KBS50]|uniref:acyltransferase family protein n=1 Tax=Plantactinospora sp. KBS50 TaxID=2024580 RepID=UPI000BAADBE6|nr:acyltransferase [Plantactinospora sp. KBS50]ASW57835.1 hypothetical protein CIK06_19235 [Plantactinospora sp. KBS50]